ncbi:DUF4157 domain-containing protein [Streptomyces sp. NPDC049627]|uniref:DUF4157 domain-containing protein n=1 Tax=Streptomyces sp. NPDC049627 TaxID=3365595 RepID=UPI0037B5ADE2
MPEHPRLHGLRMTHAQDPVEQQAAGFASGDRIRGAHVSGGRPLRRDERQAVREGTYDAGQPLSPALRSRFEEPLGLDLGDIRVHSGDSAAVSAAVLGASAYAVGPHIVFGRGRFEPWNARGLRLLAHELAHTAQQSAMGQPAVAREVDTASPGPADQASQPADPDAEVSLGPLDDRLVGLAAEQTLGETEWTLLREFMRGMWGGIQSAPPEQWQRIQSKWESFGPGNAGRYAAGYGLGLVEGLWISVKGLFEAVLTLVKLPYDVNRFLIERVPALAAKYGPRIAQFLAEGDAEQTRLAKMLDAFLRNPLESVRQLQALIESVKGMALAQVRALGRSAANRLLAFVEEPWFEYGRDIGKVVGQILFEVVLALASDFIANIVKEALAVAARLGTRILAGTVELLRSIGRLLGQCLDLLEGLGRRAVGELNEAIAGSKNFLARLAKLFDELAQEGALADTGLGAGLRVPETKAATVLESRAARPGSASSVTAADLRPPKVHPSKAQAKSRAAEARPELDERQREILEEFAERQRGARAEGTLKSEAAEGHGRRETARPGRSVPAQLERGQLSHEYAELLIPESQLPRGLAREVTARLPGGTVRLDRVDFSRGVYYEIKPSGERALAMGKEQIARYAEYMNTEFPLPGGKSWIGVVVQYEKGAAVGMFGI